MVGGMRINNIVIIKNKIKNNPGNDLYIFKMFDELGALVSQPQRSKGLFLP